MEPLTDKSRKAMIKMLKDKYQFAEIDTLSYNELKASWKKLFRAYSDCLTQLDREAEKVKELQKRSDNPYGEEINEKYLGYKTNFFGVEKVVFIIKRNGRAMLTKEIVSEILSIEPELKDKWTNPYNSVSQIIYRCIRLGLISPIKKIGAYGYTYGLKQ